MTPAPTTPPATPVSENGTPGTQHAVDLASLNAEVEALAAQHRWRTERLADGELVIRLAGKDGAHAGAWGRSTWYLLVPCKWPARRAKVIADQLRELVGWSNRSSDAEVLIIGSHGCIGLLLEKGPGWARARRKRSADHASHLIPFRTPPLRQAAGRHLAKRAAG